MLTNPAYRDQAVSNAVRFGGAGPSSCSTRSSRLRHSLAIGVQDGLIVVLVFGLGMLATTFFLQDVPLRSGWGEQTTTADAGSAAVGWGQQPAGGAAGSGASGWGETGGR